MAVSDHTDVVARFAEEVVAQVFAKFLASEGIPCHVVDIRESARPDRYGVRVPQRWGDELNEILRLTPVANHLTPIAAQLVAGQLARAGIPCYAGAESTRLLAESGLAVTEREGLRHIVAVPAPFVAGASGILEKELPWDAEPPGIALGIAPDSDHLS